MTDSKAHEVQKAFGFLYSAEVDFLIELAQGLPEDPVVVNIGAGVGTSGLAFLESRDDLELWTIDISPGGPDGGLQNELNALKGTRHQRSARHHQILGDSMEIGWNGLADLIFVDGDHTDVSRDIAAWVPRLKQDGIIAFHDYDSFYWGAVKKAIDRLMVGWEIIGLVDTLIAFRRGESL